MRTLSADELKKLRPDDNRVSVEDIPPFFCIICDEMKKGEFNADVEVGGYYCGWHKKEDIDKYMMERGRKKRKSVKLLNHELGGL